MIAYSAQTTDRLRASLSTVSQNQEGIVARVTAFLGQHGANLEASYGVKFDGNYASHFVFSAPRDGMAAIRQQYKKALRGLCPVFRCSRASQSPLPPGRVFEITIYSFDQERLVAQLAHLLTSRHVDILALAGCSYPAPFAGSPLYVLQMKVLLPGDLSSDGLRRDLSRLADEHGWELSFDSLAAEVKQAAEKPFPPLGAVGTGNSSAA